MSSIGVRQGFQTCQKWYLRKPSTIWNIINLKNWYFKYFIYSKFNNKRYKSKEDQMKNFTFPRTQMY